MNYPDTRSRGRDLSLNAVIPCMDCINSVTGMPTGRQGVFAEACNGCDGWGYLGVTGVGVITCLRSSL